MAYRAKMTQELEDVIFWNDASYVPHFWAIHKTVGWGCPNKYDDVLLVQYLLNAWYRREELKMDGIFGNKTYNAIRSFQKFANGYFATTCLKCDGKISAADGYKVNTQSGEHFYTIHVLNFIYLQERRQYYKDIRMDPFFPHGLFPSLAEAA